MKSDWVAATVRAKAMARRRAGAGMCREAAALPTLEQALAVIARSSYAAGPAAVTGSADLAAAQQATRENVLWQLRVLAGWLPVSGARIVRAVAAGYELANITVLVRRLQDPDALVDTAAPAAPGVPAVPSVPLPEYFDLGGLATAWPRLADAASLEDLTARLRLSPWGDPGPAEDLIDTLSVVRLRRLASAAPQTGNWTTAAAALIAARRVLVTRGPAARSTGDTDRLDTLLRPVLGTAWSSAEDVESFRAALPRAAASVLDGVEQPGDLWRAEASLRARVEDEAFRLLRSGLPGPDVAVGAIAVLTIDGWRVRAALAAAAAGGGSEVLDAVA